jgi:hypothetical protein
MTVPTISTGGEIGRSQEKGGVGKSGKHMHTLLAVFGLHQKEAC